MHFGLLDLCERVGLCDFRVDLHECVRIGGANVQRGGRLITVHGPLVASHNNSFRQHCGLRTVELAPPGRKQKMTIRRLGQFDAVKEAVLSRPDRLGALARKLPVVLWARDPVGRAVACWNFMLTYDMSALRGWVAAQRVQNATAFGPDGLPLMRSAKQQFVRTAAKPALGLPHQNEALDLGRVTAAILAQPDPVALAQQVFLRVGHMTAGIGFYWGGTAGLASLGSQLLFVGTTETMEESFRGLAVAMAQRLGYAPGKVSLAQDASLLQMPPHTHSSSSGQRRVRLSQAGVELLRATMYEDMNCIEWLVRRSFLPTSYLERVKSDANTYDYEPPPSWD